MVFGRKTVIDHTWLKLAYTKWCMVSPMFLVHF